MKLSAHFDRSEFACSDGCGFNTVDTELLTVLEIIRQHFDAPIHINSACRCKEKNDSVGSNEKSQHRLGRAADIVVEGIAADVVQDYIDNMWPDEYGLGRYDSFTHIDTRSTKARWAG